MFGNASIDEQIVFGSHRPGYSSRSVEKKAILEWIELMKQNDIKRICCLLSPYQLKYYADDLLNIYCDEFGKDNVCWADIEDYHLCSPEKLKNVIIPFLSESNARKERVVVHCSGGSGRTGHVLAAWLAFRCKLKCEDALSAVKQAGRNPYEAVQCGNATLEELYALIEGTT